MKIFKVLFGIIFLSLVGWNILALCKVYPPLIHEIMLLDKPKPASIGIDVSSIVSRYIKEGATREESSNILKQQGFDVNLINDESSNSGKYDMISIGGFYEMKELRIVWFLPIYIPNDVIGVSVLFKNNHVVKVRANYCSNLS